MYSSVGSASGATASVGGSSCSAMPSERVRKRERFIAEVDRARSRDVHFAFSRRSSHEMAALRDTLGAQRHC